MGETGLYYGDFVGPNEVSLIAKISTVFWRDVLYARMILPVLCYLPLLSIRLNQPFF